MSLSIMFLIILAPVLVPIWLIGFFKTLLYLEKHTPTDRQEILSFRIPFIFIFWPIIYIKICLID